MTQTMMQYTPRRASTGTAQDGPVLLATKPFGKLGAPLAVARWLAAREERELRLVTVLEPNDFVANAAGVPLLPRQYFDEERTTLAAHIRAELLSHCTFRRIPEIEVLQGSSLEPIMENALEHRA